MACIMLLDHDDSRERECIWLLDNGDAKENASCRGDCREIDLERGGCLNEAVAKKLASGLLIYKTERVVEGQELGENSR